MVVGEVEGFWGCHPLWEVSLVEGFLYYGWGIFEQVSGVL